MGGAQTSLPSTPPVLRSHVLLPRHRCRVLPLLPPAAAPFARSAHIPACSQSVSRSIPVRLLPHRSTPWRRSRSPLVHTRYATLLGSAPETPASLPAATSRHQ